MGWGISDFFSAPAAFVSKAVDTVTTNPIIAGPAALVNTGVQKVTGLTPTEQYAIGAAGGAAQGALWVASPEAAAAVSGSVGSGLATVGGAIGGALAGGAGGAGAGGAGAGGLPTLTGIVAGGKALKEQLTPKNDEPKAQAPQLTEKKSDILPMLAIGVGLISALN